MSTIWSRRAVHDIAPQWGERRYSRNTMGYQPPLISSCIVRLCLQHVASDLPSITTVVKQLRNYSCCSSPQYQIIKRIMYDLVRLAYHFSFQFRFQIRWSYNSPSRINIHPPKSISVHHYWIWIMIWKWRDMKAPVVCYSHFFKRIKIEIEIRIVRLNPRFRSDRAC